MAFVAPQNLNFEGVKPSLGQVLFEHKATGSVKMPVLPLNGNVVPFVHQLNEVVHNNEPNRSNIELNQIPVTAEPESMPFEQTSKSIDNFVENQALPKTDLIEYTETKHAIETLSKLDTSNLNGPSSDIANILDVGSNLALKTNQPESMPSEHIGQSVPSESKLTQ
ncbi:hypothetical protein SESBI_42388 [Sesbania bispinosa]|nr:hypothetical protein SESBI_42388 [Sesbania bispinosa]